MLLLCFLWDTRIRYCTRAGIDADSVGGAIVNLEPRLVEVRQNILKQNDIVARTLRKRFQDKGVFVVSLVSSPGSGKTSFLERILSDLSPTYRVAALVGDLATENDALRLARSGAPVKQITTGTLCHLEAGMVEQALQGWNVDPLDFLFIENVGNLVCPSSYDLGESLRLVLMSVTEGEDKPLKYPTIFNSADIAVVTKIDLAKVVECDVAVVERTVRSVRPRMPILCVSAKTGDGMTECLAVLRQQFQQSRGLAASS
jgi:hydrogenase nickel incorporation protein HypB